MPHSLGEPEQFSSLRRLDLSLNDFVYKPQLVSTLLARCDVAGLGSSASIDCEGLPPYSCQAFGPGRYVVNIDKPTLCVK